MCTLVGMEARATSWKDLASSTRRKDETLGSGEMTDDSTTPANKDNVNFSANNMFVRRRTLTFVLLRGTWRRHEHGFRRETVLLVPLHVSALHDVKLNNLWEELAVSR